jgi:NACHT domain
MDSKVITSLRLLAATGVDGFEGLIVKLLEELTGRNFLLAQSGSQMGRDMSSRRTAQNVISVECKRYKRNTDLNERELLGELAQAERTIPDLDLWILVASRPISSQLNESLHTSAQRLGISYFAISTEDGTPSSLQTLCGNSINTVIQHLTAKLNKSFNAQTIRDSLDRIAQLPGFSERVVQLREDLTSPIQGYDNWRIEQHKVFLQQLESEQESRAHFGQPINIEDKNTRLIRREEAWMSLNEWSNQWNNSSKPFILLGEEGDGKTWCVASWLADRVKEDPQFPPALFLTSTAVNSNSAETLISEKVASYFLNLNQEQQKRRFSRWIGKGQSERPLFLLVLDGINERRSSAWWRSLLDSLLGSPWCNQVAVIVTCRTDYWKIHRDRFLHLSVNSYILAPYSDEELREALAHNALQLSNVHHLEPLIRKPRYLDLVVRYRQRIEETGDLTVARLIYEDWRDRVARKNILLSDDDFRVLIANLALKFKERVRLQMNDINSELLWTQDKEIVLEELQTGGILEKDHGGFKVNQKRLVYGLGLLLVKEVEEAAESADTDLREAIAGWLEPHAEIDIKADICGFATLHALKFSDYQEAKVALLNTWVNSLNPGEEIEHDFVAYFPIDPKCYLRLAETVWLTNSNNEWVQEYLMNAFLRWSKELSKTLPYIQSAFERWLGFVNIREYEHERQRQINAGVPDPPESITDRIGCEIQIGDRIPFGDYTITAIEDAGLMRLGRVALAVISHLQRNQFIHEIATGCLAEAIGHTPGKYELFAWLFRSSSQPVISQ